DNENDSGGANAFIGIDPPGCFSYFGGGGGFSLADDIIQTMMTDVNGDGLPDLVSGGGNVSLVQFADGTRTSVQSVGPTPSVNTSGLQTVTCSPFHDSRSGTAAGLPLGSSSSTTATANVGVHLFGFAGGAGTVS